jgi:hypothetical protein
MENPGEHKGRLISGVGPTQGEDYQWIGKNIDSEYAVRIDF